jgi:hypothetical protein
MFTRISQTWEILKASWNVLRQDKSLILFPLFSGISCILVMASFCVPLFRYHPIPVQTDADRANNIIFYVILFCFYFVNYFVITFFNTGIIACAISRLAGGNPTLADGFKAAFRRIHLIAAWALLSATVGLTLRMIAERSKLLGRIIAALLGGAWSIMTFLAIPVMIFEGKGPFATIKESTRLLRETWGTRLVANFGFGLVFLILLLPVFVLVPATIILTAGMHSPILILIILGCAASYIILLALVQSALHSIFQAAVYVYTQNALLSPTEDACGFPVELVRDSLYEK